MTQTASCLPLYEHIKRPEWGTALLTWEREGRRGYLFEDGTLRVIAEAYYDQLKLSQAAEGPLSETFQRHLAQMDLANPRGTSRSRKQAETYFTIDEQAQLFLGQHHGGFAGDDWQTKHRGRDAGRRLKRHRDAAVEDAKKVLHPEVLTEAQTNNGHVQLWGSLLEMLQRTDLLSSKEVQALKQKAHAADEPLTQALGLLLRAVDDDVDDPFDDRFSGLLKELGRVFGNKCLTWALPTSLLALYAPKKHFCVQPTSLGRQAKWLKQPPLRSQKPNAADYARARSLARDIEEHLDQLGIAPTDLLDVCDFVRATTSPTSRKRMSVLHDSPLGDAAPGVGDDATSTEDAPPMSSPMNAASGEVPKEDRADDEEAA